MKTILLILLLTSNAVLAQVARPTFNPFMNSGFNNNQQFNGQRSNYGFQNNGFQNNGFRQGGFSGQFYPSSQGRGRPVYNNRGQQRNNGFQNNGFQNNGSQNNGSQNNGFNNSQQQGNSQANNPQLFTRRYYLNNGYLYGRPTSLWYDAKSGKMQPWVRKNLR